MKYLEKFQPGGPIGWTAGVIGEEAPASLQYARLYGVAPKAEVAEERVSEEEQKNRDYTKRKAAYMEEVTRVQNGTRPFVGYLNPAQDFIYTGMPITSTFSIADDMSKSAQLIVPAIKNGQWAAAVGNALKIPSGLVLGAASLVPGVGLAKNIVSDAVKGTRYVATHNPLYYYNASKPLTKKVRYIPNENGGFTLLNTKGNHLAFPEKGAQVQPSEFGDWFVKEGVGPTAIITPRNKGLVKGSKITAKDYASNINKQQLRANQDAARLRYIYKDFPADSPVFSEIDNYVRGSLYADPVFAKTRRFIWLDKRKPVKKPQSQLRMKTEL